MLKRLNRPVTLVLLLIATMLSVSTLVFAAHPDDNPEVENLQRRIETLEQPPDKTETVNLGKISEYLSLHGLLEVEASYTKPEGGDENSDLTLATAELSLEATLNDQVGGHLTLLYEEEDDENDSINVDEAVISLSARKSFFGQSASLHAGRMYVPFGMFNSYMVSDPLTLDLGETRDTAVLVALEGGLWALKTAAFSGEVDDSGGDSIDTWVSSLEFTLGENIRFGVSFINDLAESDIGLVQDEDANSGSISGGSAFISLQYDAFGLIAEYLGALQNFDAELVDVDTVLSGRRPEAWNLELAWMPLKRLQVAARYEGANDFQNNVKRYGGTISYGLFEEVVVALEFLRANADVDNPENVVTAQLALEF